VIVAQPATDLAQCLVRVYPGRPRTLGTDGLPIQIGDNMPILRARGHWTRCPREPVSGKVAQQVVHRWRPRPAPAVDDLTAADSVLIEPALQPTSVALSHSAIQALSTTVR
jgi:hypothetical protein